MHKIFLLLFSHKQQAIVKESFLSNDSFPFIQINGLTFIHGIKKHRTLEMIDKYLVPVRKYIGP